jgi:hypothetical protein
MTDPISDKAKYLLIKIETVYGTDPTPAAAANTILGSAFKAKPMEGADESRDIEYPWYGNQEQVPNTLRGVMTFSTELVPSGVAGTPPKWGPLLRACGASETIVAGTSVAYGPISETGQEAVTVWFGDGPTRHVFNGARGTGILKLEAQKIPRIEWTFTGLWTAPAAETPAVPVFTGWPDPLIVSKTNTPVFTVNAVPLVMRSCSFDLGNTVAARLLQGRDEIWIADKAEKIDTTVEAVPLGTFDPFGLALARSKVALELVHGTAAGSILTIAAPSCQLARPGERSATDNVAEWPLTLRPLPVDGNDQWSITLT